MNRTAIRRRVERAASPGPQDPGYELRASSKDQAYIGAGRSVR